MSNGEGATGVSRLISWEPAVGGRTFVIPSWACIFIMLQQMMLTCSTYFRSANFILTFSFLSDLLRATQRLVQFAMQTFHVVFCANLPSYPEISILGRNITNPFFKLHCFLEVSYKSDWMHFVTGA